MGNMSGSYGSHYTLWQSITVNSQSVANRSSNVTVKLYLSFDGSSYWASQYDTTYGEMKVNRWNDSEYASLGTYSKSSLEYSSGVAKDILLATWTDNVTHNADGKKTLKVQGSWDTNTSRIGSGTCSAQLVLPAIATKATISSAPNFNLGSSETVTYSNPSGGSIDISVYATDGNTNYAAYRTCTGSSYTFNFTDAELDKMYKAMGTGTSLTARVYLRTLATMDLDYKTVTITLKGNQKTIHEKVSGTWRRGKVWIKISGTWRQGVVWEKISGTWRRGI